MKKTCVAGTLALTLALGGCASTNPKDPFETYNRAAFTFNDKVDQYALKPAAQAYDYLPSFVKTGIGNFFGNLGDIWTAVNEFLQGKGEAGVSDVMRVAINSTFGIGGLIDWGTEVRLNKHKEDFGQTLGTWGVKSGPYIVLPFLGSSTLRDTAALPADMWLGDVWTYREPVYQRNIGIGLRVLDTRASLLGASNLLEDAALDKYAFMRDGYLQRRESLIHDGETSKPSYDDDDEPTKDEKQ
jgi:phospholipid-binding lipoprotein MlaA